MLLFWIKGFESTSVKDIEMATGLKTSSLYNSFGDKKQLFVISLEHYGEFIIDRRIKRYLTQKDPIKSIYDFYTTCFTDLPKQYQGIACFLLNSAVEMGIHHQDVREIVINNEYKLIQAFKNCIIKAKEQDLLAAQCDTDLLAMQLLISLKGILLSSKALLDNKKNLLICEQSLNFMLGNDVTAAADNRDIRTFQDT